MILDATVRIHAPLQTVWDVFSDIDNWKEWNPVCRECRFEEGNKLVSGSCISFELNVFLLPIRIAPLVEFCDPGRKVVWKGSKMWINAEHTFIFTQSDNAVFLKSTEMFTGPMLFFAKLIFMPSRLHALSLRLLNVIKIEAESRHMKL